jgi:hypothetical protein
MILSWKFNSGELVEFPAATEVILTDDCFASPHPQTVSYGTSKQATTDFVCPVVHYIKTAATLQNHNSTGLSFVSTVAGRTPGLS